MILSIVIVNYNVKYFLEQCLNSVFASTTEMGNGECIELEVFVVDNNSVDGSVAMVEDKFPQVRLIANTENVGFARANNQALQQSTGAYLLLLNPDTIVERDTFVKCVTFMQQHPDCGGLGVKMINGEGKFLKESKRGFPTPETSFYKISGLIKLFPRHKKIAAYYMGNLDENETNEIEILPGAYLMVGRTAYNQVGGLDESYFMYGEDIDFSWRIIQAGFKNYYLPSTRIVHYKGESTKKGSMNYVYTFYNAMAIFARKYFSGNNAKLYIALIKTAIWIRAAFSFVKRAVAKVAQPLVDFLVAFGGFALIKYVWAAYWAENVSYYPSVYMWVVIPFYILFMMLIGWLYGGYDKPIKLSRMIRGMGLGCLLLLAFYSLLDETQRYSRMVLVLGSLWSIVGVVVVRLPFLIKKKSNILLVGSHDETVRVERLIQRLDIKSGRVECYDVTTEVQKDRMTVQLKDMIHIYRITDVVFCGRDMQPQEIISQMASLRTTGVQYKIVPSDSDIIIGSNAISSYEDIFTVDLNTIDSPVNRRNKRIFDIISAGMLLCLSPVLFLFQKRKCNYFRDCWQVLVGKSTWVGYEGRRGVFRPCDMVLGRDVDEQRLNLRYTRNYKLGSDIINIRKNIFNI